jgi:hypothetical protein
LLLSNIKSFCQEGKPDTFKKIAPKNLDDFEPCIDKCEYRFASEGKQFEIQMSNNFVYVGEGFFNNPDLHTTVPSIGLNMHTNYKGTDTLMEIDGRIYQKTINTTLDSTNVATTGKYSNALIIFKGEEGYVTVKVVYGPMTGSIRLKAIKTPLRAGMTQEEVVNIIGALPDYQDTCSYDVNRYGNDIMVNTADEIMLKIIENSSMNDWLSSYCLTENIKYIVNISEQEKMCKNSECIERYNKMLKRPIYRDIWEYKSMPYMVLLFNDDKLVNILTDSKWKTNLNIK